MLVNEHVTAIVDTIVVTGLLGFAIAQCARVIRRRCYRHRHRHRQQFTSLGIQDPLTAKSPAHNTINPHCNEECLNNLDMSFPSDVSESSASPSTPEMPLFDTKAHIILHGESPRFNYGMSYMAPWEPKAPEKLNTADLQDIPQHHQQSPCSIPSSSTSDSITRSEHDQQVDIPELSPSIVSASPKSPAPHINYIRSRLSAKIDNMVRYFERGESPVSYRCSNRVSVTSDKKATFIRQRAIDFKPVVGTWERRAALKT